MYIVESSSKDDICDQIFTLIGLIDKEKGIHLGEQEDKAGQVYTREQQQLLGEARQVQAAHG